MLHCAALVFVSQSIGFSLITWQWATADSSSPQAVSVARCLLFTSVVGKVVLGRKGMHRTSKSHRFHNNDARGEENCSR